LPFNFANGLGYVSGGTVVDAVTWATVATLSVPNEAITTPLPDATLGKAFAFVSPPLPAGCTLQSFDLISHAPIASVRLPTVVTGSGVTNCGYAGTLVRWGSNGIALNAFNPGSPSYIIVISGAFVGP
jgi:hypothetical protein